jgi:N-acetylglucosamine-6-sulfatase
VETLQALDDLVEDVVNKLSSVGELDNTYLFFTSDNGYQLGENRIPEGKALAYEESIHVPLLVRGPGVQAGSSTDKLVISTDYLPTFTDLAGVVPTTPEYVDGRSLRPLLLEASPEATIITTSWRSAVLVEQRRNPDSAAGFYGIRTSGRRKYIEYEGDFRELYDLRTDPYELVNSFDASASPDDLAARLAELKDCARARCRTADDGP